MFNRGKEQEQQYRNQLLTVLGRIATAAERIANQQQSDSPATVEDIHMIAGSINDIVNHMLKELSPQDRQALRDAAKQISASSTRLAQAFKDATPTP